jgi:uncharacterized membrane protein
MTLTSDHFQGKTVDEHLKGAIAAAEIHGSESAGHFAAGIDACKDTAILLGVMGSLTYTFVFSNTLLLLFLVSVALLIWKSGRSAFLGWARLERLHRIMEQERSEIKHNRPQERQELAALYQTKGFEGQLLEDVVDVLMADDDRLLRVMLEEEMGLTLEKYEHPLKQAFGAAVGVLIASTLILFGFWATSIAGLLVLSLICIAAASFIAAKNEGNKALHASVWNVSLALLTFGATIFIFRFFVNNV